MKDRTVLVSAVIAAVIHAIILFANIGMTRPTLASAPSSIEVTLVAAPAAQASAAQAAEPAVAPTPEPEQSKPPEPPVKPEPEPVIEPEPLPEPELMVIPEPPIESEPAVIPESIPGPVPEPVLFPEPVPEPGPEPVAEPEPIEEPATEPDAGATRWVSREEPGETSEETVTGPSSVDSAGEAAEPGGLVRNAVPTFDRAPAYTYNPKPKYPRAARRFRREGTVVVLVEVLASGRVGEVAIEESSGHKLLDDAAVKAVRRWRFEPAMKGSVPVRARVKVPVEFNLKDAR